MIQLTTPRLVVRDHRPDDLEAFHKLLSDPVVMDRHSAVSRNLEQSRERLRQAVDQNDLTQRMLYFFCMEDRITSDFIGEIGYSVTRLTPVGKLVDIGYFIDRRYWGLGYTTEAMREVVRFGFEEDGVYRFGAGCLRENAASERVMQKCGFIKEGELREYQWHGGRLKDRVLYRLLRPEWAEIRKNGVQPHDEA